MRSTNLKSWLKVVVVGALVMVTGEALAAKGKARGPKAQYAGVVNLNEASAAQLDELPGVSTKAAAGIVAYRAQHPFTRAEELVKVKGFGKKRFEKLKPYLSVHGATTLKKVSSPKGNSAASTAGPVPGHS